MTPFMWMATLSYGLIFCGFLLRKRQLKWHQVLMLAGIAIDLAIVLTLQVQRNAVQTALEMSMSPLRQAHIFFSTLATVMYFPMLYSGIRMVRNPALRASLRQKHRLAGYLTFAFRTLGFLFMFSLIK